MSTEEQTLKKAIKLLEALAEPHDVDCNDEHRWTKCRKCLAQNELEHKGSDELLLALLAALRAIPSQPTASTVDAAVAQGRQDAAPIIETLRAIPSQVGWQPIASAPKDGTWILLYGGRWHHAEPGTWSIYSNCWQDEEGELTYVTHWQALPLPPSIDPPVEQE